QPDPGALVARRGPLAPALRPARLPAAHAPWGTCVRRVRRARRSPPRGHGVLRAQGHRLGAARAHQEGAGGGARLAVAPAAPRLTAHAAGGEQEPAGADARRASGRLRLTGDALRRVLGRGAPRPTGVDGHLASAPPAAPYSLTRLQALSTARLRLATCPRAAAAAASASRARSAS